MENFKQSFYNDGYIYPLKAIEQNHAENIKKEYLSFYNTISSQSYRIENKTKTHLLFKWANDLVFNENIIQAVKKILGNDFVAWNSLIFLKPPNSNKFVSFHQDQNYWKIHMDKGLTVQIALSESTIENGCLQILPGSHKKNYEHYDKKDINNLLARGQEVELSDEEKLRKKNIILKPGEFCLFHGNLVHGSDINKSKDYRFLFSIRYLTPDNKINEKYYYNYATLVNGEDKYNYFKKEPNLRNNELKKCKNFHEKLITRQAKIYAKIYLNRFSILSFLMNFRIIRDIVYYLRSY